MATVRREIRTSAAPHAVWDAIADVGALHTRLVPGFVVDTRLVPGGRMVTFGNGMVIEEPIVTIDATERRLVWGAKGGSLRHYNGAVQVFAEGTGSRVVWTADFLPHEASAVVGPMIEEGMRVMKQTLDALPG